MENSTSLTVNVDLQNPNNFDDLPRLQDMQRWCEVSLQEQTRQRSFRNSVSVLIRVVDNDESENLNQNYRSKEGPTNVLSFPNDVSEFMTDIPELVEQSSHLGDLVVCVISCASFHSRFKAAGPPEQNGHHQQHVRGQRQFGCEKADIVGHEADHDCAEECAFDRA